MAVNGKDGAATRMVQIKPPNMRMIEFDIVGTAPLCLNRFGAKAAAKMREAQETGKPAGSRRNREPKDFGALYEDAKHVSTEGWLGLPASAFRAAAISACRLVGFKMTLAKLSLFVYADGQDVADGSPLVRITSGEPVPWEAMVRNATGVADIRIRPLWRDWTATLRMRYDADQFTEEDMVNLIRRVGYQVGIGEGRPDSKSSAGLGYGTFEVVAQRAM